MLKVSEVLRMQELDKVFLVVLTPPLELLQTRHMLSLRQVRDVLSRIRPSKPLRRLRLIIETEGLQL